MLDLPYCEDCKNEKRTLWQMEIGSPANFEIYVCTVSPPRLMSDAHKECGIQEKTKNSESLQYTVTKSHAKQITCVPMLVTIKRYLVSFTGIRICRKRGLAGVSLSSQRGATLPK